MKKQSKTFFCLAILSGSYLQNQNLLVKSNEILCQANNDCISTTFCCSGYSCVNPRTCLHGNKTENDFCDYNFECLSRCCVGGKCNHILECYSQCNTNADCVGQTIEGTRVDNPRKNHANQIHDGCCSSNLCTEAIVCEGNKLLGDYCDQSTECLSQLCDSEKHTCISQETQSGQTGRISQEGKEHDHGDEIDDQLRVQIKNIVIIACVAAFICLLAIFVKCIHKQQSIRLMSDGSPGQRGENSLVKIMNVDPDSLDERLNYSNEQQRHNLAQMLAKGASRKYYFTGLRRRLVSPSVKYAGQASPIPEDSQEQYATGGYSQMFKSNRSILSRKGDQNDLNAFNSPSIGLLMSQSSNSSFELGSSMQSQHNMTGVSSASLSAVSSALKQNGVEAKKHEQSSQELSQKARNTAQKTSSQAKK